MVAGETQERITGQDTGRMASPVCEVVREAHHELRQLIRQRVELMRRIGTLKKTIAGLVAIFGPKVLGEELRALLDGPDRTSKPGFTKTCRAILMEADHAMTACEMRDEIIQQFPGLLAGHRDPVASVTTILNRLVNYGEAERHRVTDKRRAWQWVTEVSRDGAVLNAAPVSLRPPARSAGAHKGNDENAPHAEALNENTAVE